MSSKVRKIEVTRHRGKVRIKLFGEGQRRQRYLLKQVEVNSGELESTLASRAFWEGTGIRFDSD